MDHIPYPDHPVWPRPQVPYLCQDGFEEILDLGFQHYPQLNDIDIETMNYDSVDSYKLDRFLQEWAFFGVLRECLALRGLPLLLEAFIRTDAAGTKTISTEVFTTLFDTYRFRGLHDLGGRVRTDGERRADRDSIRSMILPVLKILLRFKNTLRWSPDLSGSRSTSEVVFLSISLFMEGIWMMLHEFSSNECIEENASMLLHFAHIIGPIPPLHRGLGMAGWCPNQLIAFQPLYNSVALFLCAMGAPDRHDIKHCSSQVCKALQVDEATYVTQHVRGCGGCGDFLTVPAHGLETLISKDKIPIVILSGSGPHLELHLETSESRPDFVAISHVWAHGLGNSRGNSLPRCQLQRLTDIHKRTQAAPLLTRQMLLAEIMSGSVIDMHGPNIIPPIEEVRGALVSEEDVALWIDTLCVPVSGPLAYDEGRKHGEISQTATVERWTFTRSKLRKKAIATMRDVYSKAGRVVALNNPASTIDQSMDGFERAVRIVTSAWCRRLWTLQEGMLTRIPFFFDDGRKCFSYLHLLIMAHTGPYMEYIRIPTTCFAFCVTRTMVVSSNSSRLDGPTWHRSRLMSEPWTTAMRMMSIIAAVKVRSTSHREDEAVCLAVLLDLDVATILDTSYSLRMQRLYQLLAENGRLLCDILFLGGPRLTTAGFRWAPESLMQDAGSSQDEAVISHICANDDPSGNAWASILSEYGLGLCNVKSWLLQNMHPPTLSENFKLVVAVQEKQEEGKSQIFTFQTVNFVLRSQSATAQVQKQIMGENKRFGILWNRCSDSATGLMVGVLVEIVNGPPNCSVLDAIYSRYVCVLSCLRSEVTIATSEQRVRAWREKLDRGELSTATQQVEGLRWFVD